MGVLEQNEMTDLHLQVKLTAGLEGHPSPNMRANLLCYYVLYDLKRSERMALSNKRSWDLHSTEFWVYNQLSNRPALRFGLWDS